MRAFDDQHHSRCGHGDRHVLVHKTISVSLRSAECHRVAFLGK